MSSSLFSKNREKLKEERKCKQPFFTPHPTTLLSTHTHAHNTYIHKFFSTSCVSFYGCIFMRIEILVSVPWGNDDKYAKVSSFISHGSCSLWQLQIIIYLVELVAYTSIHASPCCWNIPYLPKTLVLLCLSGAQRNSYMIVLPWIFLKSQSSFLWWKKLLKNRDQVENNISVLTTISCSTS